MPLLCWAWMEWWTRKQGQVRHYPQFNHAKAFENKGEFPDHPNNMSSKLTSIVASHSDVSLPTPTSNDFHAHGRRHSNNGEYSTDIVSTCVCANYIGTSTMRHAVFHCTTILKKPREKNKQHDTVDDDEKSSHGSPPIPKSNPRSKPRLRPTDWQLICFAASAATMP